MPKAKDDLAQIRALRDDLRRLKEQYPELTTPGAQRRLAEYLESEMEKEHRMPAKGDRTLGEDLTTLTFKVQSSVMETVEAHLRYLQRTTRYQRIGRSDCLRDIFLRGIDSIEHPPPQFPVVIDPGPEPSRPTPAAYEAQVTAPEAFPEPPLEEEPEPRPRARRVAVPRDEDIEDMPLVPTAVSVTDTVTDTPLELAVDVTQESVVPVATAETVKTARPKAAAKPKAKTARPTAKGRK